MSDAAPAESAAPEAPSFSVTLGDFSGPLDLLCHLVESRTIDPEKVRLTDVISQYAAFLLNTRRATLTELADFFSLAGRLILGKLRLLMPRAGGDEPEETELPDDGEFDAPPDEDIEEERLRAMVERFRPYRAAASLLAARMEDRARYFTRAGAEGPPWFDIGDLYGLASRWWSLIDDYSRDMASRSEEGFIESVPDAVPDEVKVDQRMAELREILARGAESLRSLVARCGPRGLIVTLLALLELSRLGFTRMRQSEEWGDVEIELRPENERAAGGPSEGTEAVNGV